MFYQLPPVGNPVKLQEAVPAFSYLKDFFHPYSARYYASGTAALAITILAAMRLKGVADPEVILPAYGCPDLVSATLYAGARPVLVDLEPERPWMDLDSVAARISERTVAIVAVDLFGIRERLALLQGLAAGASALLIEDSAQAFPAGMNSPSWDADMVVLSFGRGKPVSLLGGGAVLCRDAGLEELLAAVSPMAAAGSTGRLAFQVKATLYNRMISPYLYWLPQGLPFLHLGETRYHPLAGITAMDGVRLGLLAANIKEYQSYGGGVQSCVSGLISGLVRGGAAILNLPEVCNVPDQQRLLRYPLLLDADRRGIIYSCLRRKGLGPSIMYPASLPGIPGIGMHLGKAEAFPAAENFARRILTLPLHDKVTTADVEKMRACLLSLGN